ncbi:hypothetical protein BDN70DRAFT_932791 [Pholiota conissans]|uniref:F-box domain-containing protein n=1 Tax=Pholiota conissans TaxID=109636 RepID=A0A9P5Z3E0_9AGAR|nr:hypothetical protein BDN70DRAFT_932791 [Pholiota conissans]
MASLDLSSFPEELLERILEQCVISPFSQAPRPSWHRPSSPSSDVVPVRGRVSLLLVSKTFLRICTPLFYNTIHITSANQVRQLLSNALRPNPSLARSIRRLILPGVWAEAAELLQMCSANLKTLDLTLDVPQLSLAVQGNMRDLDAEEFCEALKDVKALTHIVIRKPGNVYLTQPKPRYVLFEVAKAMNGWNDLEHATLSFRLSDDSGATTARYTANAQASQAQQGPITALTQALSTRPKLHTLSTILPSVWNESILRISVNPSLERIVLADGVGGGREPSFEHTSSPASKGDAQCSARDLYAAPVAATMPPGPPLEGNHGIHSTGLFFVQAKKHPRLCELIRAGTSIIRTRAQTMAGARVPLHVLPMAHGSTMGQAALPVAGPSSRRASASSSSRARPGQLSSPSSSSTTSSGRRYTCASSSRRT